MNFFETQAGYEFATQTIPELIYTIKAHTEALERSRQTQAPTPCSLCPSCVNFHNGSHAPCCRDCGSNFWGNFQHVDTLPKGKLDRLDANFI